MTPLARLRHALATAPEPPPCEPGIYHTTSRTLTDGARIKIIRFSDGGIWVFMDPDHGPKSTADVLRSVQASVGPPGKAGE